MAEKTEAASDLLSEKLKTTKVGVITLFGILVPGTWFWVTSTFHIALALGFSEAEELKAFLKDSRDFWGPYIAGPLAFILVYVTGAVLRILPPDRPDRRSLRSAGSGSDIAPEDKFPYASLPRYLRNRGLLGLAELLPWDECRRKPRKRSKTFLHFVKLYIQNTNPALAGQLAKQEAFIRLLSGLYYAIRSSVPVFGIALLFALLVHRNVVSEIALACLLILLFNGFIFLGILKAFHYQRLREVVMILSVYFLVGEPKRSPYDSHVEQKAREEQDEASQARAQQGTASVQPEEGGDEA